MKKLKPTKYTRDNYSYRGFWILAHLTPNDDRITNFTITQQEAGQPAKQSITIPLSVLTRLLSHFITLTPLVQRKSKTNNKRV